MRCPGDEYAIRARLRATENVAVVQALIENLIERGSAFPSALLQRGYRI
jgi:hypothetical protein